jgi:hypothetical protein
MRADVARHGDPTKWSILKEMPLLPSIPVLSAVAVGFLVSWLFAFHG